MQQGNSSAKMWLARLAFGLVLIQLVAASSESFTSGSLGDGDYSQEAEIEDLIAGGNLIALQDAEFIEPQEPSEKLGRTRDRIKYAVMKYLSSHTPSGTAAVAASEDSRAKSATGGGNLGKITRLHLVSGPGSRQRTIHLYDPQQLGFGRQIRLLPRAAATTSSDGTSTGSSSSSSSSSSSLSSLDEWLATTFSAAPTTSASANGNNDRDVSLLKSLTSSQATQGAAGSNQFAAGSHKSIRNSVQPVIMRLPPRFGKRRSMLM